MDASRPLWLLDLAWRAGLNETHAVGMWAYPILALCVLLEGPFATLVGAGIAAAGLLQPQLVFVSAAAGNVMGDVLWYLFGRLGRPEWLRRHGRRFGLNPAMMDDLESRIKANAPRIVVVAKLTLALTIPAFVTTGLLHVRLRRWLPYDMGAECIWTGMLVTSGYYLSRYVTRLESGLQVIAFTGYVVGIVCAVAFLRRCLARWEKAADAAAQS